MSKEQSEPTGGLSLHDLDKLFRQHGVQHVILNGSGTGTDGNPHAIPLPGKASPAERARPLDTKAQVGGRGQLT